MAGYLTCPRRQPACRGRVQRFVRLAVLTAFVFGLAATSGAAALEPGRSIRVPLPVRDLAFTSGSVAWEHAPGVPAAVIPGREGTCGQVGLWLPASRRQWRFDPTLVCTNGPSSTGMGIRDVSVATRRVLWIEYVGGNFRDWFLVTASTTKPKPLRLRHVIRDVDAEPPFVIGPGTPAGIPYAVDDEVGYLGDTGAVLFTKTVASPVRALAAGVGPRRLRVAALLANGTIVGLDGRGHTVQVIPPQGVVSAIRVSSLGIAVQRGRMNRGFVVPYPKIAIGTRTVRLPAGAHMVDVAQGRVLWTDDGDLGVTVIASGRRTRLANGSPESRVLGQLETSALVWARGRGLYWDAGVIRSS